MQVFSPHVFACNLIFSMIKLMTLANAKQAGVSEWQTRQTQNLLWATTCGFKSHRRHQNFQLWASRFRAFLLPNKFFDKRPAHHRPHQFTLSQFPRLYKNQNFTVVSTFFHTVPRNERTTDEPQPWPYSSRGRTHRKISFGRPPTGSTWSDWFPLHQRLR